MRPFESGFRISLREVVRWLRSGLRARTRALGNRSVWPCAEFSRRLLSECARTDRSGREFSLLVFHGEATPAMLRTLGERIRVTDEIGWLSQRRLGILLPDTLAPGAQHIRRDLCTRLSPRAPGIRCSVYTYPTDWLDDGAIGERERVGEEDARPVEAMERLHRPGAGSSPEPAVQAPLPPHLPLWKRVMDMVGALLALVVLSPLMLAVALAVRLSSPGPVIFRQERIGSRGRPFLMFKFRTMRVDAGEDVHRLFVQALIRGEAGCGNGGEFKLRNDPRITPIGGFLRRWSLDELPQLLNVLRGEMSLVGPRPDPCYARAAYRPWYHRRTLTARPGITGLWQVEGRSRVTFEEMVRMDLRYGHSLSVRNDLRILTRTLRAVLSRHGAY
jgi:lipopolysaccharide/colanic/teichoic acid biosynthesis glycosyltransferase